MLRQLRWVACLALALLFAHAASAAAPRVTIGLTFLTVGLDPADSNVGWTLTTHGVGENLFVVDREGGIVGNLAEDALRRPDGTWEVRLRAGRLFADGTPVTATEVAASLARSNEKNAAARSSAGKMTFEVLDPRRVLIRTERATPVMAAVLAEWPFVVYKATDSTPIFTGPYMVAAFRPGDGLDLVPNPHYPDAAERGPVTIKRFGDSQTMTVALEAGELDMAFNMPVEALPRLKARPGITVKSFGVAYQYEMWMNVRREVLSDVRVRRAIDLAVDRQELALAVNGGDPATGAFPRAFPFALRDVRPTDTAAANRLLDEAGWVRGADGKRSKGGKPLDLVLVAYPQRPDLVTFQPVLRARLGALGIGIQTRVAEQVTPIATGGDFDLLLWAQHAAPAGDPGFFLNAFMRTGAGNNYTGYSSPTVDALLDKLATVDAMSERAAIAGDIQRQIFADAPVSFLLTPSWHVGLGPKLAGYEPWGSDYYIIRPDLRAR